MITWAETLPSRDTGRFMAQRKQRCLTQVRGAGSWPHHGPGSAIGPAQDTKSSFAIAILGKLPRPGGSLALPIP